jgi:hypothetical protein
MRIPLRLGAIVTLGALLLVGMLASPALAWSWEVTAETVCEDSGTTASVDVTVTSHEEGAEGDVSVVLIVDDEPFGEPVEGPLENDSFTASFSGVPLDAESVVALAFIHWEGQKEPEGPKEADVTLPTDCETPPSSSTTTTTTTAPPESSVGQETSTTAGEGALPFTGNSSGPMLLASIGLVGGGFLILLVSRTRGRHAAK